MTERDISENDPTGFEQEALPYEREVYFFLLSLTKKQEVAEDLAQDTMVRALNNWRRYTRGTNIRGWLNKIALNVFINHTKRDRSVSNEYHDDTSYCSTRSYGDDPCDIYLARCISDELLGGLGSLSENHRNVMILRYICGYSYTDIAETMGMKVGTVKSQLFRSKEMLAGRPDLRLYYLGEKDQKTRRP